MNSPQTHSVKHYREKEKKVARKYFTFDMLDMPMGTIITFDSTGIKVRVATDCKIEHEGRLWSFSAFAGTYLPKEMQNTSGAYQGLKYFSHEGKILWRLRLEKEKKTEIKHEIFRQ